MVNKLFWWVANSLQRTAKATRLTYNEINILVYYLIIPLSWCAMLDVVVRFPIFTTLCILVWCYIFIAKRKDFSRWCDVIFKKSQLFLLSFKPLGWDYWKASVIICVFIPVAIYLTLILLLIYT